MLDAALAQDVGVAVEAMPSGGKADYRCSRGKRARDSDFRVLDNDRAADVDPKPLRCVKVEVRRGFAPFDMLSPAVDVVAEDVGDSKVCKMAVEPACRA